MKGQKYKSSRKIKQESERGNLWIVIGIVIGAIIVFADYKYGFKITDIMSKTGLILDIFKMFFICFAGILLIVLVIKTYKKKSFHERELEKGYFSFEEYWEEDKELFAREKQTDLKKSGLFITFIGIILLCSGCLGMVKKLDDNNIIDVPKVSLKLMVCVLFCLMGALVFEFSRQMQIKDGKGIAKISNLKKVQGRVIRIYKDNTSSRKKINKVFLYIIYKIGEVNRVHKTVWSFDERKVPKEDEAIDVFFSERSKTATTLVEDKKIRAYMRIGLWMMMLSLVYAGFIYIKYIKKL